ncbi:radical SAM/SPASM domain-containing protein [Streptoalloteichus hindustanus]|uniref:Radical SAM additional 4Fe4S-binding SPASM domain-containing protein n=1 Tax=Streptoalloteichus hindustanus TaxID=2017 RepID=A0A1M4ZDK4_STRHI|nr:radical SAM protein [Streptoalloteichus hindustanus]SHF15862.1 radical SAM additional 4Fe4S-binding SPASM domain-containing protein [Streptoalloteichus hindustanus]
MRPDVDYRVIDLDEDAGLLFLAGNHRAFVVDPGLADRLRHGLDHLTEEERAEWRSLVGVGLVSQENRDALSASTAVDGADLAINVNLTNTCNLACAYCFADGGDYGRITEAMGHESVDHIFAFVERNLTPRRSVRLEFFGGEPLANFPVLREICERAERVGAERGVRFVHRVSTNLTLLPEGALDLFARHRFIVSVSIDGCREVQDANRPAKGGQGSYDRVIRNVRAVREAGDDITLVARMTVAQHHPSLLHNVRELWKLNLFDYFQIYPGVFPMEGEESRRPSGPVFVEIGRRPDDQDTPVPSLTGCGSTASTASGRRHVNFFLRDGMVEQFRDFLRDYPTLFAEDNRFKGVLEYERTVQLVLEGQLALSFCSGGRTYFTHSPNQAISPCHRLVGESRFDVGTGERGITRSLADWRQTVDNHPVCGRCWARYLCGGGCKQENYVASGDLTVLNEESCRYQLLLAEEVLRMLGRSSPAYLHRDRRRFDDLFVSCGRPVAPSGRADPDPRALAGFRHFRPVTPPTTPLVLDQDGGGQP